MNYKAADKEKTWGTGFQGDLHVDYLKIVDVFGDPHWGPSADEKIQVEWILEWDDGTIATIHDWRTKEPPEKVKDWSIGGSSKKAFYYVTAAVLKHYRPLIKDVFERKRR